MEVSIVYVSHTPIYNSPPLEEEHTEDSSR
jgi:hypothetical protein